MFVSDDNSKRTQEDGRGKKTATLSEKRDNNFARNNFSPNYTFNYRDLQKKFMSSEDHNKTRN